MNEKAVLLKNIYVLLTDTAKETQRGVDLLIEGTKVKKIGENLTAPQGCRVIDASSLVVVPGFVNTHHHFYQTLTRNLPAVQDAKLFDWLVYLYEVWKYVDEEAVYWSSLLAMSELLKTGCTATTDHHYLYPRSFTGDLMATQFKAADQLGMRFSPTRGSMSLSKKDGGLPPDSVVQSEEKILEDSERCIKTFHDSAPDAMHKIVLAPCSPFSVTKRCMLESSRLARKYGVRLHTHLCETMDEENQCRAMYGIRPVELMQECELIGSDVFYAHGIWFNDEELDLLAKTGSHIAHCPSSNMRLGSGICRTREMLDRGINIGIAVDGSASNDSSDMLGEMRNALLLSRIRYGTNGLTAKEVFKMGTENGAKILNFGSVGKLEEGWCADLACFDVSGIAYAGSQSDPLAALLFCGCDHTAKYTIVNGQVVVDDRRVVGVDEEVLAQKANKISARLVEMREKNG
ncbi:MAG: 8-oxoguanine deaminase [Sphaerochaetaceae bacterium]|nr:8-oxoguanine deaminase [Sphaerochaetaceae bacterium]